MLRHTSISDSFCSPQYFSSLPITEIRFYGTSPRLFNSTFHHHIQNLSHQKHLMFVPLANSITMYRLSPPTKNSQNATIFGWFKRASKLASCSVCFASAVVILPKGICVNEIYRGSHKFIECSEREITMNHNFCCSASRINLLLLLTPSFRELLVTCLTRHFLESHFLLHNKAFPKLPSPTIFSSYEQTNEPS